MIGGVEPVLRRLTIHNSKNVVINFKSIEIQLIHEKYNSLTDK